MKPVIYPYKMNSSSAKMLSRELNTVRVSANGRFRNNYGRPIVNWGKAPQYPWKVKDNQIIINRDYAIDLACNKMFSFQQFQIYDVNHPDWTTEKEIAEIWQAAGETIVVRKTLTGKGGDGIVICEEGDTLPDAPLYTIYFKKKHEYRVHVFDGKVIDFQEKKREKGNEDVDGKIRNHSNGWVFCRDGVTAPDAVQAESIKAVASLGLTFGAVDVGFNVHYGKPCVFEVNTAPGLTETTTKKYAEAITNYINKENV